MTCKSLFFYFYFILCQNIKLQLVAYNKILHIQQQTVISSQTYNLKYKSLLLQMQYPNINQQPYSQNNYPNTYTNTNPYQPNTYVPASPVAYIQPYQQPNEQPFYHGASQNPQPLAEEEYYNKNLDGSLEGDARAGFVRKVYTLLTLQLIVTIAVGFWAYNSPVFTKIFVNIPMIIILSVLLMAMSCFMACCANQFRKVALPVFILFTVVFALLIGISISGYKSKIILLAAGITLLLVAALTIYACVTKTDLTGLGPYLMVLCLVLLVFGIMCIFWRDPIVQLIYSCLSALLFAVYLVFDTQLVLGKGQYSYSLDDAYLASIQLYIDIIELFLHILRILAYIDNS